MSCKVYTVQSVYTGQGPGTVHVYTQLWAEHSQEQSKNIGMSVDLEVICCNGLFIRTKYIFTETFPAEAYSCLQVCVFYQSTSSMVNFYLTNKGRCLKIIPNIDMAC